MTQQFDYIGRGVYSLREASRLARVPAPRLRRWTRGYRFFYKGEFRFSPPPVASVTPPFEEEPVVSFADLLEVRFLNAFREYGVSWKAIRVASANAKELLGRHHPFSSRIFKTDGHTILAEITRTTGDRFLLDLVQNQYEFERIVTPLLYAGIEYNLDQEPSRWWPLGESRQVVIDPSRAFGAPIIAQEGVPTRVLTNAFEAERSIDLVAAWFDVEPGAVRDAIDFEYSLAS